MGKRYIIYSLAAGMVVGLAIIGVILFAKGIRFDPQTGTVHGTGILSVTSTPNGALVYVNNVPQDATNTSITGLKPGTYTVSIEKEGFNTWIKDVVIHEELVTEIDALLIPKFPTLQPLTYTGVNDPKISPDGQKIVYSVLNGESKGIWLIDLEERPFNRTRDPKYIIPDSPTVQYSLAQISWSPDSSTLLLKVPTPIAKEYTYYRFDLDSQALTPLDTPDTLLKTWDGLSKKQDIERLSTVDPEFKNTVTTFNNPLWSPDELYILHAKESEETIDYFVTPVKQTTPTISSTLPTPIIESDKPVVSIAKSKKHTLKWFPDSEHLLIITKVDDNSTKIEIIEITGTNRTHIFTGSIKDLQVYPNLNGSKIIALTRFDLESETYNLYSINLR